MLEREMEDLLWTHPEKFFNEPLSQYQRQPACEVGRADLVFKDRMGRLLAVEIKRGKLERGAVDQLLDYFGMLKRQTPETPVELMVVATSIPEERRLTCEKLDINCLVISEKKYRDVAAEVGYEFASERSSASRDAGVQPATAGDRLASFRETSRVEKSWGCWIDGDQKRCILAFVNAKGSCSVRTFDAEGFFLSREYGSGDYQEAFRDRYVQAKQVTLSHQPNLELHCRSRLPDWVLTEIQEQVSEKATA